MTNSPDADGPLPPELRLLKWLVIGLTATMVAGLAAVVWLLAVRLPATFGAGPPALPAGLALPAGAEPLAVTYGRGWVAVVTAEDEILLYDAASGRLRQRVAIVRAGDDSP
ncbi:MAG: hypothetical protein KJZ85_07900 [Rhodobacteraceae bacterium]|jgi:hypothetical protein|nr:hypothetical protein [Paracoccaceae bacterium]